ncbi:hypothetical protein Celaphus_00006888, partial [Cervus elaphus hippelaphus]
DLARLQEGRQPEYRDVALQKVSDSEKLLYVLEADAAIAKHMKHPQGDMIAEDIRQLKERVTNLRGKHKQIYNLVVKEVDPQVNWEALVEEKLDKLSSQSFGTDLPLVDQQVEQHNIFHNEVKAIGPHLAKEQNSELQAKYQKLLAASQARQRHLSSLQDYMQRCTNELYWLDQQARGRIQYDWSDRNLSYPSRRRQYENFIHRNLEAKEERINKLHSEGDQLLAAEHPGRNSIEEYLNLLICEESHLKYMEDYHQFHKDMKDAQELLRKVDSDLNQKYSPDFKDRYQIELLLRELDDQEKALDKYEQVVRGLQKRGQQVVPLKFRRETPLKPIPVEALCDFECDQGLISRGYSYTLQKNNGESWDLTDSAGNELTAPAVCFMIPPTDPEALALADSLGSQYQSLRQKAAGSRKALQQRHEVLKAESSGDASDLQGRQLLASLDKVASDLDRQEKAITAILRPPLEQGRAVQDSAERAKDLKNITNELLRIEPEKARSTAEGEAFVRALPDSGSTALLRTRVEDTQRRYERLVQLLEAAQEKVDIANRLEKSLQQGREMLATYETQLAQEDTVPESGQALDSRRQELAAMASELQARKALLGEVQRNLQAAKQCSGSLASRFQEHCPDLERQEAEVQKLCHRFDGLCQQAELRAQSLQSARAEHDAFCSGRDRLLQFLSHIPSYEPQETDGLGQVETKLNNQKNLLDEIARREEEVQKVHTHSQQYQQAVKDYELEAEKLRSLLDLENGRNSHVSKRARLQSPAAKVREEEAALAAKFTEVNAINRQRLQNLEFALILLRQPEAGASQEALPGSKPGPGAEETWKIQKELDEETERRQQLEHEVRSAQEEIRALRSQSPQEAVVTKEVLRKVPDPALEESFQQAQQTLAEEQHKNRLLQGEVEALRLRLRALEEEARAGGQEYVVKEVLRIEPDRAQADEVLRLRGELEALRRQKGAREAEALLLQQRVAALAEEKQRAREMVTEKEVVKVHNDPQLEAEQRLAQLEAQEGEAREKVTLTQKVVLQQDPQQAREHALLARQLEEERLRRQGLEHELEALKQQLERLEKMEVKEKVVFSESVQVDKGDTEQEIQRLRGSLEAESRGKRELDAEVSRLEAKLSELEFCNSKSSKELDFLREENHKLQLERQSLQLEARRLQSEIEMAAAEAQGLRSLPATAGADPGAQLDSRLRSLERELDDLRRLSRDKDQEIEELQRRLGSVAVKREQRENHLRRSIVVIDPDSGRELSPEEAHRAGLIDWNMFVKLRSQECDWEEISVKGPGGESSVIHDRKSGKKFSIEEALQSGRLTPAQYDRYVNKSMSIQELAVLVSGQK